MNSHRSRTRAPHVATFSVIVVILGLAGAAIFAQEQRVTIILMEDSVTIGSTLLCSQESLETQLANYANDTAIHVENSPVIATERVLKLLEIIRGLGYERVTSTSVGEPGWTLYPIPDELDVFKCDGDNERRLTNR